MSRAFRHRFRRQDRFHNSATAAMEAIERRMLMTTNFGYVPNSHGLPLPGVAFNWDAGSQGRSIVDAPAAQRSLLLATTGASANDLFLRLDGIQGGSTDAKHFGELDI